MYLQFGVLHAFCPLCTSSFLILGTTLFTVARVRRRAMVETWVAAPGTAVSLALFAAFPTAIFLSANFGPANSSMWIDLSMAHQEGPPNAPVQMAVFSDFQCPFCRMLEPTLQRIHERFPRDVVLVFRSYPLDIHPRAFPAAEAAECAAEQGKFWEYHDKLFAEGEDLSDARLMAIATAVGLDTTRFAECLKSGRMKSRVEASRREANSHGLEGVPALFINGRHVEQGLDYEHLVQRIEKLLEAGSRVAR
jgi:predicted DsbA family dithiol-disulfide isomerase